MKKSLIAIVVLIMIATTCCIAFAGCTKPLNVEIKEITDYSIVLKDYQNYPDDANVSSMESISRNVSDIYADDSLSDSEKVAQMMDRATRNEIDCEYFSYFMDKMGTTSIGDNSGTLIYQRLRRQSDDLKDDTTIKLPVNHNFNSTASDFVTSADIRYTSDGQLKRMAAKNIDNITYNETTGLLEVTEWKKAPKLGESWPKDENAKDSRSYDEARKTAINWEAEGIVDSEGIKIEKKTDELTGKNYYELTFSIDIDVANADSTTIGRLEKDNSGKNMKYEYCNFVVQIWDCGLTKSYDIKESWSGKIGAAIIWYEGSAQSNSKIVFSYSEADMDHSKTEKIYQSILAK